MSINILLKLLYIAVFLIVFFYVNFIHLHCMQNKNANKLLETEMEWKPFQHQGQQHNWRLCVNAENPVNLTLTT